MGHFDNICIRPITGEVTTSQVGTIYQDLPEKGQLSSLMVDVAGGSTYSTTPGLDLWSAFTKFEVLVDGSKVVKSYDMKQLRALAHYWGFDISQLGYYNRQDVTSDKVFWHCPILFGRFPGDKEYMLDMEQYSNPQLRITYDFSQTTVDGETYAAMASPTIRTAVSGLIWRNGAPSQMKGYIKSTEIDRWSCVVSTTRQVEIPKGNNILGVLQGARYSDDKLIDYIESMELTFDNGEWQLLDHGYMELRELNALWFPREVKQNVYKDICTAQPVDLGLGECRYFAAAPLLDRTSIWTITHEGVWNIQDLVGQAGMGAACMTMRGIFPHQNMYIPLYKYSEDDEFGIDTTKYGRIDIKTTTGAGASTSANLQTVAEFLIPNGE